MNLKQSLTSLKNALIGEKCRDGYPLKTSSPDFRWQKLFCEFLDGLPRPLLGQRIKHNDQPAVQAILAAPVTDQIEAVEALVRRRLAIERSFHAVGSRKPDESDCSYALVKLTAFFLRRNLPYTAAQVT